MQLRIATACTAPLHPVPQLHATAQLHLRLCLLPHATAPAPTPIASCNCSAAFLCNSIHAYAVALCDCAMALMLVLFPHVATPLHPVPRLHALLSRTSADAIAPCNYCAALKVLPVQQQYSCGCCCPCSCATALMHCHMLLLRNAQCRGSMQLLGCTSADASATCLVAPMPTSAPRPKHRPSA